MEKFTRAETKIISERIQKTLNELGVELDLNIDKGGVRFGEDISFKLTISRNEETEYGTIKMDKKAIAFVHKARYLGLRKELLGEPIVTPKGTYIITGYNTRAKRYPMEYTINGKSYKGSESTFRDVIQEYRPEYMV